MKLKKIFTLFALLLLQIHTQKADVNFAQTLEQIPDNIEWIAQSTGTRRGPLLKGKKLHHSDERKLYSLFVLQMKQVAHQKQEGQEWIPHFDNATRILEKITQDSTEECLELTEQAAQELEYEKLWKSRHSLSNTIGKWELLSALFGLINTGMGLEKIHQLHSAKKAYDEHFLNGLPTNVVAEKKTLFCQNEQQIIFGHLQQAGETPSENIPAYDFYAARANNTNYTPDNLSSNREIDIYDPSSDQPTTTSSNVIFKIIPGAIPTTKEFIVGGTMGFVADSVPQARAQINWLFSKLPFSGGNIPETPAQIGTNSVKLLIHGTVALTPLIKKLTWDRWRIKNQLKVLRAELERIKKEEDLEYITFD